MLTFSEKTKKLFTGVKPKVDFSDQKNNRQNHSVLQMRQILRPELQREEENVRAEPLNATARSFYENRYGENFSNVRLYPQSPTNDMAQQMGARAFTQGNEIVWGAGTPSPETPVGQKILAHELAHVAQQRRGVSFPGMSAQNSPEEKQADCVGQGTQWGQLSHRYGDVANHHEESSSKTSHEKPSFMSAQSAIQRVQLTYDDGPDSAGYTRTILNALNQAGARATFYLVGKRITQGDNWQVVFDIAAAGHWLGNHAFDWDKKKDEHIFLHGTPAERANKIFWTEWAIRDALIKGKAKAQQDQTWTTIPAAYRAYIDDVIAHGTGRFRTPGFKSKIWKSDGRATLSALYSLNQALAAAGIRPLKITEVSSYGLTHEGVTVDPKDWVSGRTQAQIEQGVKDEMDDNSDSILLHSRLQETAKATPAIVAEIKKKQYTFDPTIQGNLGSMMPKSGFAGVSSISNPPTVSQVRQARTWFRKNYLTIGPFLAGSVALGIFQMAQSAGQTEVMAFARDIRNMTVVTNTGNTPLANWMMANPEWSLFTSIFENWVTKAPFPRIPGLTQ